jgi:hypothetical protein
MIRKFRCTCMLSLVIFFSAYAQQYPHLHDVVVSARVETNSTNDNYYYNFTIINGSNSLGAIETFDIDISRKPGTMDLDTTGLEFENDGFIFGSFQRTFPHLKSRIVPVGLLASPGNIPGFTWSGGFSNDLTAGWGADSALIEPNQTLSGFVMMSKGLPTIRRWVVSPYFDVDSLFPSLDDPNRTLSIAQMDSIREACKFSGWTIGPTAPTIDFSASSWLDSLVSYKHQALGLGWIDNQGIANSLDQKLDNAKSQLQRGNTVAAKNTLQALINEVEAQKGKHLTSEAYALLKFNTEYLISKLQ